MMVPVMEAHAKALIAKIMPPSKVDLVKFKGKHSAKQYSLEFESKIQAISFKERALVHGLTWTNTRTMQPVTLKMAGDKSICTRITDSVLYHIYPLVQKHLQDSGHFKVGMKLGNAGMPRRFFIIDTDGEGYPLYTIKVNIDKSTELVLNYENLTKFGIGNAAADAIASEAVAGATNRR